MCSICFSDFVNEEKVMGLNCIVHKFHASCLKEWLTKTKSTCPQCH